jgi:hypothetical protein
MYSIKEQATNEEILTSEQEKVLRAGCLEEHPLVRILVFLTQMSFFFGIFFFFLQAWVGCVLFIVALLSFCIVEIFMQKPSSHKERILENVRDVRSILIFLQEMRRYRKSEKNYWTTHLINALNWYPNVKNNYYWYTIGSGEDSEIKELSAGQIFPLDILHYVIENRRFWSEYPSKELLRAMLDALHVHQDEKTVMILKKIVQKGKQQRYVNSPYVWMSLVIQEHLELHSYPSSDMPLSFPLTSDYHFPSSPP